MHESPDRNDFVALAQNLKLLARSVGTLARELSQVVPGEGLESVADEAERCEIVADALTQSGDALHLGHVRVFGIEVTEYDGTARLVLSGRDAFPKELVIGQTRVPHEREVAGILFFNDEGVECGGLIFSGKSDGDGYLQTGSLTFDQYQQDQVVQIWHNDVNGRRAAGLRIADQPDVPMEQLIELYQTIEQLPEGPERDDAISAAERDGLVPHRRLSAGKNLDRSVSLDLHDDKGRVRLRVAVQANGVPAICMFDEEGNVIWEQPDS